MWAAAAYTIRLRKKHLGDNYEIEIVLGCPCGLRPGTHRASVGAGRQNRNSERSVRRLRRLWRQVVVRGRQAGSRGFWRQRAWPENRGDLRGPSEQARSG